MNITAKNIQNQISNSNFPPRVSIAIAIGIALALEKISVPSTETEFFLTRMDRSKSKLISGPLDSDSDTDSDREVPPAEFIKRHVGKSKMTPAGNFCEC
ncbi:hypothetical protein [uncultured Desulfobacter sp.]|uniref:hypothetical protein n=1 Tax=uncultured Desulfobacter sp. TaxID=240139 RepID=UPI002AAAA168|nr:hypothetical protein [uncultured Desulfobacter sp.]